MSLLSKILLRMSPRRRFCNLCIVSFSAFSFLFLLQTELDASAISAFHERIAKSWNGAVASEQPIKDKTEPPSTPGKPKYKPTPTYTLPPVRDPFPLLATSTPPPIPKWNRPRENLHTEYGLPVAPPLLIGFTRSWPLLLQAVVSYITAGWPPSQIYVIENTGVQLANARGQLTLQNPFYLNHTTLEQQLGVNIIRTPVLLTFAQLQNFYLSLTYERGWPYYFWSHMDVLTLSLEEGMEGVTPPYNESGYKTVYELCCAALQETISKDPRWGLRLFAYDHLALVNPEAYESVGGWDTLIPYYLTDCDMHSRLIMENWSIKDERAGIVTDINTALEDLAVLYRVNGASPPKFVDPNPPPPAPSPTDETTTRKQQRGEQDNAHGPVSDENLDRWRKLRAVSDRMFQYKHGERGRNTWQAGQQGGFGEKFYYPADGIAEGIDVITEAGKEVFRRKWGHRDCDLVQGAGLQIWDQWKVEKDW